MRVRWNEVEAVRFLERPDHRLAQAALQFVLGHPVVSCAIPGVKSSRQVKANAAAADGTVGEEDWKRPQKAIPA